MLATYDQVMAHSPRRSGTGRQPEPVRITSAPVSAQVDRRSRERRYLASMALRVACFVGAVAVGPGWLRWVLVAGAVLLPWFAVVMANAASSRSEGTELRHLDHRHELGPGS